MKIKFTEKEVPEVSKKIIRQILKKKNKTAKVLALSGNLGTGKTTLTKELAKQFGIKENIVSPTFVIMKFYNIDSHSEHYSNFKKIIHIDAYRLEKAEELLKIGWNEIMSDSDNLIIIEWPEKVEGCFDKETFWVKLEHIDDQTRSLEFCYN